MRPSTPRIPHATSAAPAAFTSPRTDARGGPTRGARSELVTGGRADHGARMVPLGEQVFSSPSHDVLSAHAGGDSALERLMRHAPGAAAGNAHPPALAADQWPTPGAAYSPFQALHTPSAVAIDALAPLDELAVQLDEARAEVERLEPLVEPTRRSYPAPSRSPSPSSLNSSASFATITSSSSSGGTPPSHSSTSSGTGGRGAAGWGRSTAPDDSLLTAPDDSLLPMPAAVAAAAGVDPKIQ